MALPVRMAWSCCSRCATRRSSFCFRLCVCSQLRSMLAAEQRVSTLLDDCLEPPDAANLSRALLALSRQGFLRADSRAAAELPPLRDHRSIARALFLRPALLRGRVGLGHVPVGCLVLLELERHGVIAPQTAAAPKSRLL